MVQLSSPFSERISRSYRQWSSLLQKGRAEQERGGQQGARHRQGKQAEVGRQQGMPSSCLSHQLRCPAQLRPPVQPPPRPVYTQQGLQRQSNKACRDRAAEAAHLTSRASRFCWVL